MEYCGGGSVSDLIQANSNMPLDEEVIAYISRETLAGLAYLHSIGKVVPAVPFLKVPESATYQTTTAFEAMFQCLLAYRSV